LVEQFDGEGPDAKKALNYLESLYRILGKIECPALRKQISELITPILTEHRQGITESSEESAK